tara:strand:+ start:144 stop:362 length:219 start_codon:yes stop_codon:yes gene_type:complete
MDWEFTEDFTFKELYKSFKENEEDSAMEFLVSDGASYYLELMQNAAGEGIDLSDADVMSEFQLEIIDYLENN